MTIDSYRTRMDPDARSFHHTTPWSDLDMIVVNGYFLCYIWEDNEMVVVFPGGRREPLHSVQTWAQVRLPKRVRNWRAFSKP
jgi:glutamine amidotransferase-like uncharacterized protein